MFADIPAEALALGTMAIVIAVMFYSMQRSAGGYAGPAMAWQRRAEDEIEKLKDHQDATEAELAKAKAEILELRRRLDSALAINAVLGDQIGILIGRNELLEETNRDLIRRLEKAESVNAALRRRNQDYEE